ncbi:MAG: thiamine phosphate synthase [Sandaracinaceae bacterium]|nr:thiamine phosphate synthase [Sandaracinaceae bacterium]
MLKREPLSFSWPRLIVITDPDGTRGLAPYVEALDGRVKGWMLILRDYESPMPQVLEHLESLVALSQGLVPVFLATSDPVLGEKAMECGASGLHLPERAPSVEHFRKITSAPLMASIHSIESARKRALEGADALLLAPFGPVPGKGPPLSQSEAKAIIGISPLPIFALGGLQRQEDFARAFALGAYGIAVRRAMAQAPDGAQALLELLKWCEAA